MKQPLRMTGTLLLALSLWGLSACGDSSTAPNNTNNLPPEMAASQGEGMVSVVTDMIGMSDDIAAGNFDNLGLLEIPNPSGPNVRMDKADITVSVTYDDAAGQWSVNSSGSDSLGNSFTANYMVQFRDAAGNAQVEPGPTTSSVVYAADLSLNSSFTNPETGASLSANFEYNADVSMTDLIDGPVHMVANGDMSGSAMGSDGQNSFDYALAVSWDLDVSVPFDGCPTGGANMRFGSYSASVTYDGTNQASWGVYDGTTLLDSGFETMDCGQLAK